MTYSPSGFTPADPITAPQIGVGMLGYAFMGRAHSHAFRVLQYMMPTVAIPKLIAIAGRDGQAVSEAASRFGYAGYYTDWRQMLEDDRIQLFDNGAPNDVHAEPVILAAQKGMHILCEKPLARTAEEAKTMLDAVKRAGVKAMVAFNYRFVPAVRLAHDLIASGKLGRIYHFRATYLQDWLSPQYGTERNWRMDSKIAGAGALGDLSHIIDLSHYLMGTRIKSLSAKTRTFIEERKLPGSDQMGNVDVDDAFAAVVDFENGAMGTLEGTRVANGRRNANVIEINAENGSLHWNLERLNELDVYWANDEKETLGFRNVLVTDKVHPFMQAWWPPGHILGWEHTFVHEIHHLLDAIFNGMPIAPHGATFQDGYHAAVVSDAILKSGRTGRHIDCQY